MDEEEKRKRNKRTFNDYISCKCHPASQWHRFGDNLKCTGCSIDYFKHQLRTRICPNPNMVGKSKKQIEYLTRTYHESLLKKSTRAR